ncbi:hypothetical protein KD050_01755 [Psychrobacillus sp. INOP01]|uniref:hypothetical protein n=1 Tax=Psychrobacillus sp. INOP01 TaxID=2829187 RepID=UPI001BAADCA4|nr:hypothetical protein [Psychrobacillus sp. INOP01]QUG42050.1 hypothetical protein KD050_01755 [Psychrobacillus sp. INOP01]
MRKLVIILLVLASIYINPTSIFANGTSYFEELTTPSGHVLPMEESVISIESEKLYIEIEQEDDIPPYPIMLANVRVIYEMENKTEEDLQVPIAFPQPGNSHEWSVDLDGTDIPLTGNIPFNQEELVGDKPHIEWVNPRTGQTYSFGGYDVIGDSNKLGAKTFEVTLNAKSIHTLTIEYEATLGIDERASLHPIYRLDYLLHPASYWSDFKDLDIEVKVPKRASVYVNLPLQKEGNTCVGAFETLPEENLVLFISPSSGLLINLFNSRRGALLSLVIMLPIYYVIIRLLKRTSLKHKMSISLIVLAVFGLAGLDIVSHKILGYPLTMVQYVLYIMILLIMWWMWYRVFRKNDGK